jgi:HEAT repeat protein
VAGCLGEQTFRLTHALRRPETAVAAVEALRGALNQAAVEGLVELVYQPPSARAAIAALSALEPCDSPLVLAALNAALDSLHSSVRLAAVQSLHRRGVTHADEALGRLLREDSSWPVRRAAVVALAERPNPDCWNVLDAATDPHWRVRHALIQVLLRWSETDAQRREIDERLAATGNTARIEGLRKYLHWRWSSRPPDSFPTTYADPARSCPFWDWDAAVLARNLERMGELGRRQALDAMPFLLGHADERVSGLAVETLRYWGEARHHAQALALLDEPRNGAGEVVLRLMGFLDRDQAEELTRFVLHAPAPSPAQLVWALDQAGIALPFEEEETTLLNLVDRIAAQPAKVRCALVRLIARWRRPQTEGLLQKGLDDPDPGVQVEVLRGLNQEPGVRLLDTTLRWLITSPHPLLRAEAAKTAVFQRCAKNLLEALATDRDARVRVSLAKGLVKRDDPSTGDLLARLQADPHPHVRASALTLALAAELVKNPTRETSWHVLAKAARMAKVPLWKLEPKVSWQPEKCSASVVEPMHLERPTPPHARRLGRDGSLVSSVGISGHYGLPVEGFVRAVAAGVNLLFWEPNYQTLTDFAARLAVPDRAALHFVAGTFEADGQRVRRDAERALRLLKVERLSLFLVFWVQSWERISPDVREGLERLKEAGKIAVYGLSTHARPLAIEALEAGWDPVMVRHSAAHRGAEEQVFPRALECGTSLLTFNNTCYGRLLQPRGDHPPPRAADCYRYTLSHPAVTACWSAPATLAQLEENLAALRDLELPPDRREMLIAHGDAVYREDVTFRKLVRSL